MSIKTKFTLFILVIHVTMLLLSLQLLQNQKLLFLLAELGLIISLTISIHIYKSFIRPVNLITAGIESIQDRDFNMHFVKVGQSEMDQLISVYNKMQDELREERTRHQEEHLFLEKLIHSSPSGIIILDYDNKIESVNPAACKILGCSKANLLETQIGDLLIPLGKELENLAAGQSQILKLDGLRSYKCRKSHFIDQGFQRNYFVLEELTEELIATERRAYSQVIRLMSHEINNSVGAVNSILNSFITHSKNSILTRQEIEDALEVAVKRNIQLNKFISNFADVVRIPLPQKSQQDIVIVIQNVIRLFENEFASREITFEFQQTPEHCILYFDLAQIEQVLVNLIWNAIEAISKKGEISILLETSPHPILRIRDSGIGLSSDTRQNIFLPFYSTKKNGQGIGLTLVREILVNHQFSFNLDTKPEGFTEFTIQFTTSLN